MTQHQKTILSLENLTVRYSNNIIFPNLTFQIKEGEHWAILGESGAGKTALLKTIEGKFNITSGKIRRYYFEDYIQENTITDPFFTYQKLIAFIDTKHSFRNLSHTTTFYYQQRYNSFDAEDAQTVAQYLKEIQTTYKVNNPSWTFEEVIETLKLSTLIESQIIKLSNGETKRLMIAAALLKSPKILLLDNPLIGLDVATRNLFNDILDTIKSRGVTIVMATTPFEIPAAITHVAVLKGGEIIQSVKKEDYDPSLASSRKEKALDTATLQQLLSSDEKPQFNIVVKMENVAVSYGEIKILDNINWEIKQGEHWALSGPNGSGKSTLLSLINGDNPQAYANNITLFDKKRGTGESIWEIKKKIGFVSPELHQYFPLDNTCAQIIESGFYDTQGLFRKSIPENRAKALKWMSLLNIEAASDQLFRNVSSSTQRLCLLARALIKNPPLLILDEPCQGLDAIQQTYFRDIIDTICALSSTTLIYVTHYEEELPRCIQHKMAL